MTLLATIAHAASEKKVTPEAAERLMAVLVEGGTGLPDRSWIWRLTGPRQAPLRPVRGALLKARPKPCWSATVTTAVPESIPVALAVRVYDPSSTPRSWNGNAAEPSGSVALEAAVVQVSSVYAASPASGAMKKSMRVSASTGITTPPSVGRTAVWMQSPARSEAGRAWIWSASGAVAGCEM